MEKEGKKAEPQMALLGIKADIRNVFGEDLLSLQFHEKVNITTLSLFTKKMLNKGNQII